MVLFGRRRDVGQWLEKGKASLLQGKGNHAESSFGRILRDHPDHLEALKGLMEASLLQGKSHVVIERFDSLPMLQQERWQELLLIALAMQVGHLKVEGYLDWLRLPRSSQERLPGIRRLAKEYTKCGALAIQWAESALLSHKIDEANQALRQLRDAEPRVSPKLIAHLYAQRDALMLREHPEITTALEQASEQPSPEKRLDMLLPLARRYMSIAAVQRDVGLACVELNQPDMAIRYLNRAVNVNPYWIAAWIELGLASITAMRLVRAREALFRALYLSDSPWLGDLHQEIEIKLIESPELSRMEFALDRMAAKDPAGAIEPLQRALEINASRADIHWWMGKAYSEMRQYARSTACLREAWVHILPDETDLRAKIKIHLEQDLHARYVQLLADDWADEAVDLLEEAMGWEEGFVLLAEAHRLAQRVEQGELSARAVLAYEQGRPRSGELALDCFPKLREALSLAPQFPEARLTQAVLLAEAGDLDLAQEELYEAQARLEPKAYGAFHVAGVAYLQRDLDRAMQCWQECLSEKTDPWATLAHQNVEIVQNGREAELILIALPTYQHKVKHVPSSSDAVEFFPSSGNLLFPISPSAEMVAGSFPLSDALEQASLALPKLSRLIPETWDKTTAWSKTEEQPRSLAEEVLRETEKISEVALFDHSEEKKKKDPAFPFASGQSSTELPVPDISTSPELLVVHSPNRPLFEISPSSASLEWVPKALEQQAAVLVPRLSDVAPQLPHDSSSQESLSLSTLAGTSKQAQTFAESSPESPQPSGSSVAWAKWEKNSSSQELASAELSLPTNRSDLPVESAISDDTSPPETPAVSATKPNVPSFSSLDRIGLFESSTDLESFVNDAFVQLETTEKKQGK